MGTRTSDNPNDIYRMRAVYEIRWHSSYRIVLSHEGSEMSTLRAIVGSVETIRRIKHGWK